MFCSNYGSRSLCCGKFNFIQWLIFIMLPRKNHNWIISHMPIILSPPSVCWSDVPFMPMISGWASYGNFLILIENEFNWPIYATLWSLWCSLFSLQMQLNPGMLYLEQLQQLHHPKYSKLTELHIHSDIHWTAS